MRQKKELSRLAWKFYMSWKHRLAMFPKSFDHQRMIMREERQTYLFSTLGRNQEKKENRGKTKWI